MTKSAENSIKLAVANKCDDNLTCTVEDQDLVAREAWYHNACRRKYTRSEARQNSHKDSEASKSIEAHKSAFEFMHLYGETHH